MPTTTRNPIWARLARLAVVLHAGAFVLLHVLEPGVSPISGIITDYAATDSSWLASATFPFFALAWFSIAIGLGGIGESRLLAVGRVLLLVAGLSIVASTVAPALNDPRTPGILPKLINLLLRPGLFLGIVLVSVGLKSAPGWRGAAATLTWLAIAIAFLFVTTVVFLLDAGWAGLGQRVLFVLIYLWIWMLSSRMAIGEAKA